MYELFENGLDPHASAQIQLSGYYDELIELYAFLNITVSDGNWDAAEQQGHDAHKTVLWADNALTNYTRNLDQMGFEPNEAQLTRVCTPLLQKCEQSVALLRQQVESLYPMASESDIEAGDDDQEKENTPALESPNVLPAQGVGGVEIKKVAALSQNPAKVFFSYTFGGATSDRADERSCTGSSAPPVNHAASSGKQAS